MSPSREEVLERTLGALGRERKRVFIKEGVLKFLLVIFLSLTLAALSAHFYSSNTYFWALKILAIIAGLFGFGKFLLPALLKKEKNTEVAKELEKISPGLGEDSLNAVLLKSDLNRSDELGVSKPLIEAHLYKVARRIEGIDLSPAIPKEKIKHFLNFFAPAFVFCLVAIVIAPRNFNRFLLSAHILPPSEPDMIRFADIELEYRYPAYTKIAPQVVKGTVGDVKAIKGTQVIFRAMPTERINEGSLVMEKGATLPAVSKDGKLEAQFIVTANGSFYIEDKDGKSRSQIFQITSVPDTSPKVAITAPLGDVIDLDGMDGLDIDYNAQDDFGLTKLVLTWNTEKGEATKLIKQTKAEPESTEGRYSWNLSGIEAAPGQIIEAKIMAYDNDTISGSKAGVSNTIKIKLNDEASKHREVFTSIDALLDKLLEVLAENIENRPKGKAYSDAVRPSQQFIAVKIAAASTALSGVLQQMKEDDLSDYSYFLGLSKMQKRIDALLVERNNFLASFAPEAYSKLDGIVTKEIKEFENDILFIDSLIHGESLRESVLYGRDTVNKYNELSDLLGKFKDGKLDDAAKQKIGDKIEELKQTMSELASKLSSINGNIGEEFLNADAFDSVDMNGKLDEVMKLVEEGKIDEAMELMADLGNSLESMMASLESGLESFNTASLSKDISKLGEVVSKLKGAEESQKSLKEKTEAYKESLLKSGSKKNNLSEFVAAEKKKVERLKQYLIKARNSLDKDDGESVEGSLLFDRLIQETSELGKWLEAFELNEALKRAQDVEEGTQLAKNLSKIYFGNIDDRKPEIQASAKLATEIRRDLERLGKSDSKEAGSQQIAKKQDQIQKETAEFSKELEGLKEDFTIPMGLKGQVGESAESMGRASKNLKNHELSKAISNQEDALKSLQQAREEAEGLLEDYQMSARGRGPSVPFIMGKNRSGSGNGIDTSYVEIPSADESKSGKDFKESLLKALKDGSPEGYSELNKKYYERIIK